RRAARADRAAGRRGPPRGRAVPASARPLRPLAGAADRAGPGRARHGAHPARGRRVDQRRRRRFVSALQPGSRRGEGARGDPARQPRRQHRPDRSRALAAALGAAGDPGRPAPSGRGQPPPPLRPARRGRARAARARDPPRGLSMSDARRLATLLGVLAAFAFAGALLAAAAVYLIAAAGRGLRIQTLLLAGEIVGIFFSAAITVVVSLLDFNRLGGVIHWLLGNLAPIPPRPLALFAV